ncbi:LysR family transcriptional regulator [Vibrio ponticus]|uniref:LysR family transcriptional regulator n=1 Tax=Vibrio ponticus TaxID=265668 RepID=A0A3N3E241_9VIBR|nr:LysR family transcriptional regulator [Vibrio ponticus]ROV60804.1 LysR family transcriptional regulator [Vibrio ponticus]
MTNSLLSSRQPIVDKIVFFCAVIQTGSFREASIQQGISPAAGSRWVKELEDVMSVELIKRSTRQLVATQAGQLLFERFSPLLVDINGVCEEVQNLAQNQFGEIRISSTPLFARQYLTKIVAEYMQMYPNVKFRIFIEAGDFDPLTIDFALRASGGFDQRPTPDSLLVRRCLLQEPLYLCASPAYLQMQGTPASPEDLNHHRCLYAKTLLGGNRWSFDKDNKHEIVTIKDTLECDNSEMLLDLALEDAGIAYLPHSLVHQLLSRGDLVHLLPEYQCATFDIDLYYRPQAPMPERCGRFKQFLFQRVAEMTQ